MGEFTSEAGETKPSDVEKWNATEGELVVGAEVLLSEEMVVEAEVLLSEEMVEAVAGVVLNYQPS